MASNLNKLRNTNLLVSLRFSSLTPRPGRALPAIFVIYLCHLKHITFLCAIWITKWLTNEIFGWLRSWSSGSSATSSKCYLKLKRLILKLILHFPSSFHLLHVLDLQYSNIQNSFQSQECFLLPVFCCVCI